MAFTTQLGHTASRWLSEASSLYIVLLLCVAMLPLGIVGHAHCPYIDTACFACNATVYVARGGSVVDSTVGTLVPGDQVVALGLHS